MKKQLLLSLTVLIFASGCAIGGVKQPQQSLIGKWTGNLPDGYVFMIHFKDDKNVEGNIKGAKGMEYTAKYTIDFSTKPISIDFFDFDNEQMKKLQMENLHWVGIIKFIEKNKLFFRANVDTQRGRPTNFDSEAIELTRE